MRPTRIVATAVIFGALALTVACNSCRRSYPSVEPLALAYVPFRHLVIDPNPLTGHECCTDVLAIGDLNGDGHADVILGAERSGGTGLVWYEYPLWQRHEIGRGEFTTDGKVWDLDGDRDADIVVGDSRDGLTWFENLGGGGSWARHILGSSYTHDIEIGDLDGDGSVEVVTTDKNQVTLWRRNPAGWVRETLVVAKGEGLAVADLDGDRDLDVVIGATWLENPGRAAGWARHSVSSRWPADTRVRVADMSGDGRLDVILSASEGRGHISWFEASDTNRDEWREHRIAGFDLVGAHSLTVNDFDGDRDLDVVVAEMHTSETKRVLLFVNDGSSGWRLQTLSTAGSHNMQAADLDLDGDVDLVGKNYAGAGRALELWQNLTRDNFDALVPTAAPFVTPPWNYNAIDQRREDDQVGKMGLVTTDINLDRYVDVIAGSFIYLHPGTDVTAAWPRIRVAPEIDLFFATDVDDDGNADLVGIRGGAIEWLEARGDIRNGFTTREIGRVATARTQGYTTAQLEPGGKEELVLTRGTHLLYLRIPPTPEVTPWPHVVVSTDVEEAGVAAADIDRDGQVDLVVPGKGGESVVWFKNPGTPAGIWRMHMIGRCDPGRRWIDRVSAADIDRDGRVDVVTSEETQAWAYSASVDWWEAPVDPLLGEWKRHTVTVLRSVNSLDVLDMDHDGDLDVLAAEHTDMRDSTGAPNNLTLWFENAGTGGRWRARVIEAGPHSSHIGARGVDLNGDGTFEVVSLAWNQFRQLHLWWQVPASGPRGPD